jgi:hypothetical protein
MRDLTLHEMDEQLAEQLPARELMGGCYKRPAPSCNQGQTATSGGNGNGFGNGNHDGNGFLSGNQLIGGNGNGNGIGNGSSVNVTVAV